MLNGLRDFTVKMVAGANVATVAFMLLVGYSDLLNPERFPAFCNAGLLFPVFLSLNLGFLIFWVVFRARGESTHSGARCLRYRGTRA